MNHDEKENTRHILASKYMLLASQQGAFLTWPAVEQEMTSRSLKIFFDQVCALVNRNPIKFFRSTFLTEVIFHTNDTSVYIALALVYPSDTVPELVLQTSDWVKKTMQDALAALETVAIVNGPDSAKVDIVEGKPGEIINGLSVCADKHAAVLANGVRAIAVKLRDGLEGEFTMDGVKRRLYCKEVASPVVADVTPTTEVLRVRSVSDETMTSVLRTQDGKTKVELQFSNEQRKALLDAQRTKGALIEVVYTSKVYHKIGRVFRSGGLILSIRSGPQGTFDFDQVVSREEED